MVGRQETGGRNRVRGLTVSPKWRAIFRKGMLNSDSDLRPDLVMELLLLVGEDEGEGWVAAEAAAEEDEEATELEELGSRRGCGWW